MSTVTHVFISYRRDGATNQAWAERIETRLTAAGFRVWRDVKGIEPGQRWSQRIPPALDAAALVLCVVSDSLLASDWVDNELNYAQQRQLLVVPLQVEAEYRPPIHLSGVQPLDLHDDRASAWDALFELVARHAPGDTHQPPADFDPVATARRRELDYLDRLLYTQKAVAQLTRVYTDLAGVAYRAQTLAKALPADLMPVSFRHQRATRESGDDAAYYSDILDVFTGYEKDARRPRLAVLGESGAGKSFSLRRLADRYATTALEDPGAPLPLLVELGKWTDPGQSLDAFVRSEVQPLAADIDALLADGRVWLMLDALNEIPTAAQSYKVPQILPWLADPRLAGLVISCREGDFVGDLQLDMDTLKIEPLDPPRIHASIRRYLGIIDPTTAAARAEAFFWRLATGDDAQLATNVEDRWRHLRDDGFDNFAAFWRCDPALSNRVPNRLADDIASIEQDRRALLRLARNPYLLNILLGLNLQQRLPPRGERRAAVFAAFVDELLLRERERYRQAGGVADPPGEQGLPDALGELAWSLQRTGFETAQPSVYTRVATPTALRSLNPAQLKHAVVANLIDVRGQQVRFTHQLLQEYFAALGLKAAIDARQLRAQDLWSETHWWRRMGWKEVVNTLAGFYVDDPDPLIAWLGDTNPEALVDGLAANGLADRHTVLLQTKGHQWLARMVNPALEPDPAARAALGRAVGKLDLDDRPGVGLNESGLPDIAWIDVPAGEFRYGNEIDGKAQETRALPAFYIARYPVTNRQYRVFVDTGGYDQYRWWKGLAQRPGKPGGSSWREANHPREYISWYEAVAYCRWLSVQLGYELRLPSSVEWEKAARGTRGRQYPWGDSYAAGHANINEKEMKAGPTYLEQTTAVGLYPQGVSPYGVADMAGNVAEWCVRTDGTTPELRGGSWYDFPVVASASSFLTFPPPGARRAGIGFRLCCSSPKSR